MSKKRGGGTDEPTARWKDGRESNNWNETWRTK
jgi:hypothetical protein